VGKEYRQGLCKLMGQTFSSAPETGGRPDISYFGDAAVADPLWILWSTLRINGARCTRWSGDPGLYVKCPARLLLAPFTTRDRRSTVRDRELSDPTDLAPAQHSPVSRTNYIFLFSNIAGSSRRH